MGSYFISLQCRRKYCPCFFKTMYTRTVLFEINFITIGTTIPISSYLFMDPHTLDEIGYVSIANVNYLNGVCDMNNGNYTIMITK